MPNNADTTEDGMKATQVLKVIPEFHGRHSENVHEFLDAADECFSLVKETEKKILLTFLRTKLKGAAFKAIQYVRVETWDELKEHLQRRFGIGDSIRFIEKEFTMLVQNAHETVAEFGERTCTLAAKITEYNIREKKYDPTTFEQIMEDRILVQFITGLREPVRFQTKSYKTNDYREALSIACNLEKEALANREMDGRNYLKKLGLRDQGSYQEKPRCFICKKNNHKPSECYFKEKKPQAKINIVTCYFCNKQGHIAKECRSRIRQQSTFTPRDASAHSTTASTPQGQGNFTRRPLASQKGRPAAQYK